MDETGYSAGQWAGEMLVALFGTLGALFVARIAYQWGQRDQRKGDVEQRAAEEGRARLQREKEEAEDRLKLFNMLVAILGELHENQKLIDNMRDGILPSGIDLHEIQLPLYSGTFGRFGVGTGEALMNSFSAVRAYNQVKDPIDRDRLREFTEMRINLAEEAVIDYMSSQRFLEPEWTGAPTEEVGVEVESSG